MATIKQIHAIDNLVGNGGNITKAMIDAGYTVATANTPQKLTESKGFKELMQQYGLTQGLIATSLVDDIKQKPKNRYSELRLGAEILGMKAEEDKTNKTLIINITGETATRYGLISNRLTEESSS